MSLVNKPLLFQAIVLDIQDPLMLGRVRARIRTENYEDIIKSIEGWKVGDEWTSKDPLIFNPLLPYFLYQVPDNGEFIQVIDGCEIIESIRVLNSNGTRRLNDGKPDPLGRYFVGSLAFDGKSTSEQLFVIDKNRKVIEIDNDLTLSNGLA